MADWRGRIAAANAIDIHYVRTGGAGPPLVLLHGLTGSGRCWLRLARALERDFDVVMPDARGHGASSAPPGGYRYDVLAQDVLALIETLDLVAPILLGHSMGGLTAAVAAARAGERVRGVILADPTFLEPSRQLEVFQSDVVEQHRRFLRLRHDAQRAEARARHPHRDAEVLDCVLEARRRTCATAWEILAPPNPDYHEVARAITAPCLLLLAEHGVVSWDTARALQHLNPRLRVEQIQGAGHALQYDQPERFEQAVRRFLHSLA